MALARMIWTTWLGERAALLPNAAMIDGLPSANNFDSLIVGRYQNLLDQVEKMPLDQALPVLSRMHIGYLVSPRELDLPIVTRTSDAVRLSQRSRVAARLDRAGGFRFELGLRHRARVCDRVFDRFR